MRPIAAISLAVLAVGAAFGVGARAADLGPVLPAPPAFSEPDQQFEFGTGWYLRGDLTFGPEDQPKLTASGFDNGHTAWGWGAGGGVGYKINDFLRADITGDYLDPYHYSNLVYTGSTSLGGKGELQRYDGLANLYVDLGTWYGLTPYVGGGVGIGVFNPSEKVAYLDASGDRVSQTIHHGTTTNLAWAAMAGVAYQVDPNIALDLGYRHIDLGHFATTLVGYSVDKHFTADEIRVGLRYMLF